MFDPTKIGLLYDCDGVLIGTFEANLHAYRFALNAICGSHSSSALTAQAFAQYWGAPWRDWLFLFAGEKALQTHQIKIEAYPGFIDRFGHYLSGCNTFVEHVAEGRPVAVVSNASKSCVTHVLDSISVRYGLSLAKVPILTPSDTVPGKPDPALLLEGCRQLRVLRAILIDGDARRAGSATDAARVFFVKYDRHDDAWSKRVADALHNGAVVVPVTRAGIGLILAAGAGRRLAEVAGPFGKPLVEVGGVPVVCHAAHALSAATRNIVLVVNPHTDAQISACVRAAVEGKSVNLITSVQEEPRGVADAIGVGRRCVNDDLPFVVACGDSILATMDVVAVMSRVRPEIVDSVDMAWSYKTIDADIAKRFAVLNPGAGPVGALIEKPQVPPSEICWCGPVAFKSSEAVRRDLLGLAASSRGEFEIVDLMNTFLRERATCRLPLQGNWHDIGTPEALQEARQSISATTDIRSYLEH